MKFVSFSADSTERGSPLRDSIFALLLVLLLSLLTSNAIAADVLDRPITLNIAETTKLEDALINWGTLSGVTVMMDTKSVKRRVTQKVSGTLTARRALALLLKGSGLSYRRDGTQVRVIGSLQATSLNIAPEATNSTLSVASDSDNDVRASPGSSNDLTLEKDKSKQDANGRGMEQVIVTAEKRSERAIDVPASIGVMTGEQLESLQVTSLADMANYMPGLSIQNAGAPGLSQIVLRGLSSSATSGGAPLVATYIDDIAVSNSGGAGGNALTFDLMPYDLDHLEVLRGPQGTLYGADSMGGLIKYVLRKPDPGQFSGSVGGDLEYINASARPGGTIRGYVNLPLIADSLALRVSGFYKDAAGYIDNVALGTRNTNHFTEDGARISLLWLPSDQLSIQATVLTQYINADDVTTVTLNGNTFQPAYGLQTHFQYFPEPVTQDSHVYNITVNWNNSVGTFTSSSSYTRTYQASNEDISGTYGQYVTDLTGAPVPGALVNFIFGGALSKLAEELRLASHESKHVTWMIGAAYSKEVTTSYYSGPAYTAEIVPLPIEYNLFYGRGDDTYKDWGIFGNGTYKFTERFDISAGYRYSS